MSNLLEIQSQQIHLDTLLKKLAVLIKQLPTSLPGTTKDGPITKFFTSHKYNHDEGPYYTFNKSWECVFQVSDDEREMLVLRGKHGLPLVLTYLLHFSKIPEIVQDNGLFLMAERVQSLISTVESV
jgi:hypothetical protein